jgi:CPA2 family monovalent cation:H+ antiporter-2
LQALIAAGLTRASAVVITYIDTTSAFKVLANIREHAPTMPVVVRTLDDVNLTKFQTAGATEVVPEAIEASLMLASHALALVGVPMRKVLRLVQDQRDARYSLLRGYFHGAGDDTADDLEHERLSTLTVHANAVCIGLTLGSLKLEALDVRVVSLRSASGKRRDVEPALTLQEGDTLVMQGTAASLARAETLLSDG